MANRDVKGLKPGQKAPFSGQYLAVGSDGAVGHEVTVVKGEPMPPTQTPPLPKATAIPNTLGGL